MWVVDPLPLISQHEPPLELPDFGWSPKIYFFISLVASLIATARIWRPSIKAQVRLEAKRRLGKLP